MFIHTVIHLEKDLSTSTSTPQVLAMADIMAGTTLEDLEYSDEEDQLESDESDADEVKHTGINLVS